EAEHIITKRQRTAVEGDNLRADNHPQQHVDSPTASNRPHDEPSQQEKLGGALVWLQDLTRRRRLAKVPAHQPSAKKHNRDGTSRGRNHNLKTLPPFAHDRVSTKRCDSHSQSARTAYMPGRRCTPGASNESNVCHHEDAYSCLTRSA